MADTEISKNVTQEHPDFSSTAATCEKLLTTYECGEELFTSAYLHQHVFEDSKQFKTRIDRAFTLAFMQNMIRKMVNKMYGGNVMRHGVDLAPIKFMLMDATGTNVSFDQFMRTLFASSILFGKSHVLVDYSYPELSKEAVSKMSVIPGAEEESIMQPNLRMFSPLKMRNWNFIPRYGYEACVFTTQKFVDGQVKDWYLYVDYDSIVEYDESGAVHGSPYKHGLGYTPVFTLTNYEVNSSPMAFSNAMYRAQLAVTNLCSITDEIAERHAFSQLVCPDDGTFAELAAKESDYLSNWRRIQATPAEIIDGKADLGMDRVLRTLSQSSVFTFPANTGHPPNFISPDATQLDTVWNIAKGIMTEAAVQLGLFDSNGNVALEGAAPYFSGMADSLTGIERKIIGTALLYMGTQTANYNILYPKFELPVSMSWLDVADKFSKYEWLTKEARESIITDMLHANASSLPMLDRTVLDNAVEIQEPKEEINPAAVPGGK